MVVVVLVVLLGDDDAADDADDGLEAVAGGNDAGGLNDQTP